MDTNKPVTRTIQLGGLAPPLSEQLDGFGFSESQIKRFQTLSDGITLLTLNDLLTLKECTKAKDRLIKLMQKAV